MKVVGVFLVVAAPLYAQETVFIPSNTAPWECSFDGQFHSSYATETEVQNGCRDAEESAHELDFSYTYNGSVAVIHTPAPPPPECTDGPLTAPQGLFMTGNVLSWSPVAGACGYRVRGKETPSSPLNTLGEPVEPFLDLSGQNPGPDWCYLVDAVNSLGAFSGWTRTCGPIVEGGSPSEVVISYTWDRATENTDDTPYTDPLDQRLYYADSPITDTSGDYITIPWQDEATDLIRPAGTTCARITSRNTSLQESIFSTESCGEFMP